MPDIMLLVLTWTAPLYAPLLVLGALHLAGRAPAPSTTEEIL